MSQRVVILGSGESGVGAALLAKAKGYDVFVSDLSVIQDQYLKELEDNAILFEQGEHTESKIVNANLIVKSPGIPDKAPIIKKLKELGIEIISEIEFGYRHALPGTKYIAITGSNGKTTTTLLTYHIAKTLNYNVGLAGNVGTSLARQVVNQKHDLFVLELSSFQLDNMYQFHPNVAVLLNITPDHLDRYEYKFENYVASKFRITQNLTAADTFIYYLEDPATKQFIANYSLNCQLNSISLEAPQKEGGFSDGITLLLTEGSETFAGSFDEVPLKGKHNQLNVMAAYLAVHNIGASFESIHEAALSFINAPHRLEKVGSINQVQYINDSKATNVDSVWYALEATSAPIVWIAGGVDKGNDYSAISDLVKSKVKVLISLNKDHAKLIEGTKGLVSQVEYAESMNEAIQKAMLVSEPGDTVLLSPACASFDLFKNYEDRGNQFRSIVQSLMKTLS
ncbi:MAG: UDP-N-acetylmuramoyl-L-alanine--D-glutamate ligase [Cytophagaceae bacterium]